MSLEADPNDVPTWCKLAEACVSSDDENAVMVINGHPYTKRLCYLHALELDPDNFFAWAYLTSVTGWFDEVSVNSQKCSGAECFSRADALAQSDAEFACHFAEVLGQSFSWWWYTARERLYCRALELNPEHAQAWLKLAGMLSATNSWNPFSRKRTSAIDGRMYTQLECYIRAVELLDPEDAGVWYGLGRSMKPGITVEINGRGGEFDQEACFQRALELDPSHAEAKKQLEVKEAEQPVGKRIWSIFR